MRYSRMLWVMLACVMPLFAQLESLKEELSAQQLEIYRACTLAVSAPCCKNGQPVLEHESPVADQIKDIIKDKVLAGLSRDQILANLADMTFGPANEHVVFTVPKGDWLGKIVWSLPALIVLIGIALVFILLSRQKLNKQRQAKNQPASDEDLLLKYRDRITKEIDTSE